MKVAILFCFVCVIACTYGQAGRTGMGMGMGATAAASGSSDAMRAMMMSRLLAGSGGAGSRNLANMLLIRGKLKVFKFNHDSEICI